MHISRRTKIQFALFTTIALVAAMIMLFAYMRAAAALGIGHYTVTVELPRAAGLYPRANVTYRGTEVGRVESVNLTDTGVAAVLKLKSDIPIPADLDAEVHSQSAIGEQYVALLPHGAAPPLKNGDVIPLSKASVPPDINALIDSASRGLQAIPRDNLKTVIDESYTAVGGLGPELSRLVNGSTQLAIDARKNLDSLTTLIDQSQPVLDSQTDSSDAVSAWASNLANITSQLKREDTALAGFIDKGGETADQARQLIERLEPTLPVVLANLVSVGQVAVTYQPAVEQLLVLLPQAVAMLQPGVIASANTKQDYKGVYLDFNLNLNLPPACTTGFLPAQQRRNPSEVDYPDRPAGDLYCRVPQDSPFNVRGARNYPCLTVPGKRAPTVKMCESDENYVPLNDGYSWKGDPNATLSGQDIPQLAPGAPPAAPPAPAPPPIAVAQYDPATGTYVGPDGHVYTQTDLAHTPKEQTWQSMLTPPTP
jgi:phospholipid/cholesterol/gamma-HCH transport system substrate-binding protein